jgi:hypothetical protein
MTNTKSRAGSAVVSLRSGRHYEGRVEIDGVFAHFSGRRRLVLADRVDYRPADDQTWPHSEIVHIRWIKAAA